MLKTFEAIIDHNGKIILLENYHPLKTQKAIVTILDDSSVDESTLLSEVSLSDWNRPEEEEAWKHFQ